jgi:N-acetylmuramoyl-L-alanine amidase
LRFALRRYIVGKATLFIAAGHGGNDRGNTATGHVERDELIAFTGGMRRWYDALGVRQGLGGVVFLDDKLDLGGEVAAMKPWRASERDGDLAVNIYLDYRARDTRGGALVLYDETTSARTWAEAWLRRWCAATGIRSNGVHRSTDAARAWRGWPDYGWTAPAWPGVIVELGCLNSPADLAVVRNPFWHAFAAQMVLDVWRGQ